MLVTIVTIMLSFADFQMPGLRRIAIIDPADLPPLIREMAVSGIVPVISSPVRDIDFTGDAELSFSKSKDGKESTTLSFTSSDCIPFYDVSFIVEDQMGQRRVVGALEPPFPLLNVERTTAGGPGQRRRTDYTVTWPGYPPEVTVYLDDDNTLPIRDHKD